MGTSSTALRAADGPHFEVQPYELPNDQGYRHMTAYIDGSRDELIAYGGLGNGGPRPPTPINHDVFTVNLAEAPAARAWEKHDIYPADRVVASPWFTSTRGFVQLGERYYLACDDTDEDKIYSFDPTTYRFEYLTKSTLAAERRAGDCCAVGVRLTNSRNGNQNNEDRIYILGGRNSFASPIATVRYYSITHDRWEQVADLNIGRSHLACAPVLQHGQPLIYAIGGGNSPQGVALRSMEIYDVLRNEWALHDDYLPEGRTRLAIQNVNDKYLLLIGGDAHCAGGGAVNLCPEDHPLTTVDMVDLMADNRFISSSDCPLPQLQRPRATPATALRKTRNLHELYVIGGRTLNGDGGLEVETTTEVLTFDWPMAWHACGAARSEEVGGDRAQ